MASDIAVRTAVSFVTRNERDPHGTWPCKEDRSRSYEENLLRAAAWEAHLEVLGKREGRLSQMGATLALVLVRGDRATLAHVGDSRVYRMREGQLEALTCDHSYYEELRRQGMKLPERERFAFKNHITRALGIAESAEAEVRSEQLLPGDVLLVCSDGLHDPLGAERIAGIIGTPVLQSHRSSNWTQAACHALVADAFARGGTDNITAALIRVVSS